MFKVHVTNTTSNRLLADSAIDVMEVVREQMSAQMGRYIVSNGVKLGLEFAVTQNPWNDYMETSLQVNLLSNNELKDMYEGIRMIMPFVANNPDAQKAMSLLCGALRERSVDGTNRYI